MNWWLLITNSINWIQNIKTKTNQGIVHVVSHSSLGIFIVFWMKTFPYDPKILLSNIMFATQKHKKTLSYNIQYITSYTFFKIHELSGYWLVVWRGWSFLLKVDTLWTIYYIKSPGRESLKHQKQWMACI